MNCNYTLYSKARESALKSKNNTAIVFYGKRISFKYLLKLIDTCASRLKAIGINAGDTVSLCLPNTPSAIIAFYAINKIGGIINLIHPYAPISELKKTMNAVGSKTLIVYDLYISKNESEFPKDIKIICSYNNEFMGKVAKIYYNITTKKKFSIPVMKFAKFLKYWKNDIEAYPFKDDQAAVYLPSGGTTGESKIIMHNCRVFNELAGYAQHFLSEDISHYKAMYSVLPIFHGFGLCMNMHLCIINGVTNVMCIKFDPSHLAKVVKKENIAVLTGVPAMYLKLFDNKYFQKADLSSIKECFVGGDSAPQTLIDDFNRLLKRQGSEGALYVGYGLTETVTVCAVTSKRFYKSQSVGYPLPDTKFAIIKNNRKLNSGEIGEICISTPIMMLGYYNSSESPTRMVANERWLFTGDYGYLDGDGFLYFKQRIKNTIKVNGIPVFPSEIENLIEKINGVKRVAAIGIKDIEHGEVVKVIIEPEMGADTVMLKKEILETCAKELIVYAQPRKIEFRNKLPVSAIGKIDRSKL